MPALLQEQDNSIIKLAQSLYIIIWNLVKIYKTGWDLLFKKLKPIQVPLIVVHKLCPHLILHLCLSLHRPPVFLTLHLLNSRHVLGLIFGYLFVLIMIVCIYFLFQLFQNDHFRPDQLKRQIIDRKFLL